ncbi:MAG: hypothetical protein HY293_20880 [Planctomycetes bacterium]|nr:hypothetical protein [Planctomycetota bacterium]
MLLPAFAVPVLLACGLQAPPVPPDAKWKAEFKLSLIERDGKWVFIVDGTTNIPAETKLRARVYALEVFSDFKEGEREDDEPLVWEDEGGQPGFRLFNAVGGRFHEEVYTFVRKPYSIRYRAKVHYFPRDQTDAVTLKVGDDEFFRKSDLRLGTDADYAKELQDRVQETAADLTAIEKLYGELADTWEAIRKNFKEDAWKKWKEPWADKVEAISKRNEQRYSLWAVWMERQAKMRVGGMCELMRRITTAIEERFLEGAKNEERIQEMLKAFHDYFEEAIEVIGINAPLDVRTVGPLMAAYDKALVPLRAWIAKPQGDPLPILRAARRDGLGSLLELVQLLQNRKRGYLHLNEISVRFTRLLELFDPTAAPEALKKGLEEHDAALAEFKKFAGLK